MPKSNRRTDILRKAVAMFNQGGVQNVPLYKIASAMEISSGNLTYYFRTKEILVKELASELEEELLAVLREEVDPKSAMSVSHSIARIVDTLWRYQFFFDAQFYLHQGDPYLKEKFETLRDLTIGVLKDTFDTTIAQGAMKPFREPNSSQLLADNIWAMWLMWLKEDHTGSSSLSEKEGGAKRQSAIHYFSLVEPYLSSKFAPALYESLLTQFSGKLDLGTRVG